MVTSIKIILPILLSITLINCELFEFSTGNLSRTIHYEDDYFDLNVCRERNLKYRRHGMKYVEIPRKTRSVSRMIEDDRNEINESRDDGKIDSFNQITPHIDDVDNFYDMINGQITSEFNWSFIAAIGYTQIDESVKYFCRGVIISERFIITAAHCRINKRIKPDTVRVGDRYLKTTEDDDHAQQLYIEKFFFHPSYRFNLEYNDIAIIKTNDRIIFNNHVTPACIDEVTDESMVLKATGFGKTSSSSDEPLGVLDEISFDIYPTGKCSIDFDNYPKIPDGIKPSQICLKGKKLPNDRHSGLCLGNSGSPIQYTYKYEVKYDSFDQTGLMTVYDIPIVVGIVSFGSACGMEFPLVNTRTSFYREWILCTMNGLMTDTSTKNLITCVKN